MRYEKIEINGKESLPQTNGRYDCVFSDNTFGQASYDKSGISASQSDIWWINKVKFYYEPLPQTEISDMVVGIVCRYWKFDSEQQHLSSWHDKQDCIVELRSQLSRIEPEEDEDLDIEKCLNTNKLVHQENFKEGCIQHCDDCDYYYKNQEQPVSEPESINEIPYEKWKKFTDWFEVCYHQPFGTDQYYEVEKFVKEEYANLKSGGSKENNIKY
jgi:hypothetical protein